MESRLVRYCLVVFVDLMESRSALHSSLNDSPIRLDDCELITFIPSVKCIFGQYVPDCCIWEVFNSSVHIHCLLCEPSPKFFFYYVFFHSQERQCVEFFQTGDTNGRVIQAGQDQGSSLLQRPAPSRGSTAFRPPQSCMKSEAYSESYKIQETLGIY